LLQQAQGQVRASSAAPGSRGTMLQVAYAATGSPAIISLAAWDWSRLVARPPRSQPLLSPDESSHASCLKFSPIWCPIWLRVRTIEGFHCLMLCDLPLMPFAVTQPLPRSNADKNAREWGMGPDPVRLQAER